MFISSGTVAANSIQKGCAVCVLKVQRKPKRSRACYQHSWARAVTKTKGGEVKIAAGIKKRSRSQQRRLNNRQWREFVTLFFHASVFVVFSWRVRRRSSREAKTHSALFRISSPCVSAGWLRALDERRQAMQSRGLVIGNLIILMTHIWIGKPEITHYMCNLADGTNPRRAKNIYLIFVKYNAGKVFNTISTKFKPIVVLLALYFELWCVSWWWI